MKASEYFGDWMDVIDTVELRKILSWISIIDKTTLCPSSPNIFKAFRACPLKDCKVVFLGQDPYPQQGVATGILFGNSKDTPDHKLMVWIFLDLGCYYRPSMMSELIIIILLQYHIGKLKKKQNLRRMKVWIGLSPDDVQGMVFDLTPLELRDLIGKPNWVPTKFLGWRTWKTSVYFKIII